MATMIGKGWEIPVFTEEEGMKRWKNVREKMQAREIDCLVISGTLDKYRGSFSDIRYLTNFITWMGDEYCVFPVKEDPTLYLWASQHLYWAKKVSWVKDIVLTPLTTMAGDVVKKIKSLGLERGTIGIVSQRTMLAHFYSYLMKELPNANFVEAGDILRAARLIKSPAELEYVRKAGECADLGFKAMAEVARPGITEYQLISACEAAMISNGAECGSFSLFNSKQWPDGWGFPVNGTYRQLQKGDVILNELTPCYGGYYVQLCRPISLGKPSADFVEMSEIHKVMYQMGRDGFRAGNVLSEVDAKVSEYALSKRPFTRASATFQLMDSPHEEVYVDFTLRPGMAFQIHPWTNPPEADMKAEKNHMGHIYGDTCIVTEGDPECVSKLPMEVTIV